MRRGILILVTGVVVAVAAYCGFYLVGTTTPRGLLGSTQPELAWLKHEFNLSDAEFARISELHAGYLPKCREHCRHMSELGGALSKSLALATQLTPEVEKVLVERAQIRATCQMEMLKHFFEVSRAMPPDQGKRYLAWVREHSCLREPPMNHGMDHGIDNRDAKLIPAQHP